MFSIPPFGTNRSELPIPLLSLEPNAKPLDPLEEILVMDQEKIFQGNIPKASLKSWVDRFYQGIEKQEYILRLSADDMWAYLPAFFEDSVSDHQKPRVQLALTPNGISLQAPSYKDNLLTLATIFTFPDFWKDTVQQHFKYLLTFYQLSKLISFPDNDLVERVFSKIQNTIIEKIIQLKEIKGSFFSFKVSDYQKIDPTAQYKKVCCYKTSDEWLVGDLNAFPNTSLYIAQLNKNHTKTLILNKNEEILSRPSIVVEARMHPGTAVYPGAEKKKIVQFKMIFYQGEKPLSQNQDNATSFTFIVDLNDPKLEIREFRQFLGSYDIKGNSEQITHDQLQRIQEEISLWFNLRKSKLLESFQKGDLSPLIFEHLPPQNHIDQLWVLSFLIEELKKSPAENAKSIELLAESLNCTFSAEEIQILQQQDEAKSTQEGYAISPKAVADKLAITIKEQLNEALKKEQIDKLSTSSSSAPNKALIDPDLAANPPLKEAEQAENLLVEDQIKQRRMEKEIEKQRKRELFEWEKRKAEKKEKNTSSTPPLSMFSLGSEDQFQVDSIYKGQPMKAKEFALFAMGLLRKKAEALGAKISKNQAGSHPKIHFKRRDKTSSGGVTFHIQHGRDSHGDVSAQKETLNRILRL